MNRLRGDRTVGPALGRRGRKRVRVEEAIDAGSVLDAAWELFEAEAYGEAYAKMEELPRHHRVGRSYLLIMTLLCGELEKNRRMLTMARRLVELDPTVDFHWGFLGEAARRKGGVRAAVRIWHEALRRMPSLASIRWRLAAHYCMLRRLQPAREQLKIALHLDPQLIRPSMDEPVFEVIWETVAEAGPPPPDEGDEWNNGD